MEAVIGLLFIGVALGIAWTIYGFAGKLTDKGAGFIERKLRSNTYEQGQVLIHSQTKFEAPVNNVEMLKQIREGLALSDEEPYVSSEFYYLDVEDENAFGVCYGSKLRTWFTLVIACKPAGESSTACEGEHGFAQWTQGDDSKVVEQTKYMLELLNRVNEIIAAKGGTFQVVNDK
ncbi:MAG: hypothetical protein GX483_07030 [Actinomycetaceae bacterium]|nr:hypothetical protein [Actinomycetaceae bacterium]